MVMQQTEIIPDIAIHQACASFASNGRLSFVIVLHLSRASGCQGDFRKTVAVIEANRGDLQSTNTSVKSDS